MTRHHDPFTNSARVDSSFTPSVNPNTPYPQSDQYQSYYPPQLTHYQGQQGYQYDHTGDVGYGGRSRRHGSWAAVNNEDNEELTPLTTGSVGGRG